MASEIPVIDFNIYGLNTVDTSLVDPIKVKELAADINSALGTIGFCYLKNHGLLETLILEFRQVSREFFLQPRNIKNTHSRIQGSDNYLGWVGPGAESPNPERPGDIKEAFDYSPNESWGEWPNDLCQDFHQTCSRFFQTTKHLAERILEIVATGLELPNNAARKLIDSHKLVGKPGNHSEIRTLYYPPLPTDQVIKPGQVRLGEHFDFGTLTLVFQDNAGGLEVCNKAGNYIPATPIPGTVLINVGDILQRWTSDRLVSTKHRIMLPEDEHHERQSLIFFLKPDDASIIRCLDGSDKYPPASYLEHLARLNGAIY